MKAKMNSIFWRLRYIVVTLPVRCVRLIKHLLYPFGLFKSSLQRRIIASPLEWFAAIPFYVIDIFGVPELYEMIFELLKWNIRSLTKAEKAIIQPIFEGSVGIDMLRLDEKAVAGPKHYAFAYASFHTINSYGRLSKPILIHEVVHVWQYHLLGSVYTLKALRAQRSTEGYAYGKFPQLQKDILSKKSLIDYNFEQQAEIIMDAYRFRVFDQVHRVKDEDREQVYAHYCGQLLTEGRDTR